MEISGVNSLFVPMPPNLGGDHVDKLPQNWGLGGKKSTTTDIPNQPFCEDKSLGASLLGRVSWVEYTKNQVGMLKMR